MSGKRQLLWQIVAVGGLTLLGKAGAFGKDVLLSLLFGAGMETDAYFIAYAIPGLVLAGILTTISLVFLPIYSRAQASSTNEPLTIIKTATIVYLGLALTISILTAAFAGQLIPLVARGASEEARALATFLTRLFAIGFIFSGWVALQNAILQANKSFIWPMAIPVFNHSIVITSMLLIMYWGGSIIYVVASVVFGWVLLSPIAGLIASRYYSLRTSPPYSKKVARNLVLLSIPVFFSISLDQINAVIDLAFGSNFGQGAISHLSYASRLAILLSGLFSLVISYFIFPYLADSLAKEDTAQSRKLVSRGLSGVIILTTPLVILCSIKSEGLVTLVFQRGQFSVQDMETTALVLRYYAIGILFVGVREVLNRVFLANQQVKTILSFGVIAAIINVATSLYFMSRIGLPGIALGTACSAISYVALQVSTLVLYSRQLLSWQPLVYLGISLAAGTVMIFSMNSLSSMEYFAPGNLRFILEFLLSIGAYFIVLTIFIVIPRRLSHLIN